MRSEAVKSRSTGFFERYALSEMNNVRLHYTVYVLGAVCGVLALVLLVQQIRPRAIFYVTAQGGSGTAIEGQIPESAAGAFASGWLMDWMNYTPETVEEVHTRAVRVLGPGLLSQFKSRSTEEKRRVLADRLSSIFTQLRMPEVKTVKDGFVVRCSGRRVIYMGKEELSSQPAEYVLHLRQVPPGKDDPWGLVIDDVRNGDGVTDEN